MISNLKNKNEALWKENAELKAEALFKSLIGLRKANFDTGEHCEKSIVFYDPSRRGDDIVSFGRNEENKRGRKSVD